MKKLRKAISIRQVKVTEGGIMHGGIGHFLTSSDKALSYHIPLVWATDQYI